MAQPGGGQGAAQSHNHRKAAYGTDGFNGVGHETNVVGQVVQHRQDGGVPVAHCRHDAQRRLALGTDALRRGGVI